MDTVLPVSPAGEEEATDYQSARAPHAKGQLDDDMGFGDLGSKLWTNQIKGFWKFAIAGRKQISIDILISPAIQAYPVVYFLFQHADTWGPKKSNSRRGQT